MIEFLGIIKHSLGTDTRLGDFPSTILNTEVDHIVQILRLEVQRNVLVGQGGGWDKEIPEVNFRICLSGEFIQVGGGSPLVNILSSGVHLEASVLGVVVEFNGGVGAVNNVDNDLGVIRLDSSASKDDIFNISSFDPSSVNEGILVVNSILEKGWDGRGEEGSMSSEIDVSSPIVFSEGNLGGVVDIHGNHDTHSLVGVSVELVLEIRELRVVVDQSRLEEESLEVTASPVGEDVLLGGGFP